MKQNNPSKQANEISARSKPAHSATTLIEIKEVL